MQNGHTAAAGLTIVKPNELAAQRLTKELDEAIAKNDFKSLVNYLDQLNDDKEKELFAKVINKVNGKISLFAKIVYVFPQNQEQWGCIITKMIMLGADVYANYSNSCYRIFDKLRRDADDTYFYSLCNLLFGIALENKDSKKMLTLIVHSPGLVPQIRYIKREKFYQVLLTKIFALSEKNKPQAQSFSEKDNDLNDKAQLKASSEKNNDRQEHVEEVKVSQQYAHLNELIKFIHPDNFAHTADKRRYVFAMIALRVRILQLAKKIKALTEDDKIFIEKIISPTEDLLPCISQFFTVEYKRIIDPSSIAQIDHNHQKGIDTAKLLNEISIKEDSLLYETFNNAIKSRSYDVVKLICTKFPFHIFLMIDQNGKSLWDEIIKKLDDRRNKSTEQLILIILSTLKTKLSIKSGTLLPVACALGQLELVNYFLLKDSEELEYSYDIVLSFNFAKYYHYYEIIALLCNDNKRITYLRVKIDLKEFSRHIGLYLYTVTSVEGLQSIYNFITFSLKKLLDIDNELHTDTNIEIQEKQQLWESLLYGLKSRSEIIKRCTTNAASAITLFDKINSLFSTTLYFQTEIKVSQYGLVQEQKLTRQNSKQWLVPKAYLEEYSADNLIHLIEINEIESAMLIFKKFRHILKNQKIGSKLTEIIEVLLMQIKFGHIMWEPLLISMFKLAIYHIKCIELLHSKIESGEVTIESHSTKLYKQTLTNL